MDMTKLPVRIREIEDAVAELMEQVATLKSQVSSQCQAIIALQTQVTALQRPPQVVHRDAGTGQFVSAEEAAADPEGTVTERR